jgi:nicotinamidase-related amidase
MERLVEKSADFLSFLEEWLAELEPVSLAEVVKDPARTAVVSVDILNGFCEFGPLSSPRVGEIVGPITDLFVKLWDRGVQHILLAQDTHEPDAVEFSQWPPHCVRGTAEAEPVDAFKALRFFERMIQLPKNSIHSGLHTGLTSWTNTHPEVDTFIVVGDCTDLCTYQLAMHLRLEANARQYQRRVIVPVNAVDTYDRPVAVARQQGGMPHPGDLLHAVFLYHMALNGVEIVASLA